MTNQIWTNDAIRKRLGVAGFLEVVDRREVGPVVTNSYWQRGNIYIRLYEEAGAAPVLMDITGDEVNPNDLGVRNENTQTGNDK
jgi:hypothetical protein